jgi:hypothetical protein
MKAQGSANSLIVSNDLSVSGAIIPTESEWASAPTQKVYVVQHPNPAEVEKAVYAYIRAIRALGRTTIHTAEIAAALSLPVREVNQAVPSLNRKGVRVR